MEDALESVFGYLDTNSLKQCRVVCSFWNPVATRVLMRTSFCELQSIRSDSAESFYLATSLTSVKVNGVLLSQLSSKKLPSSFSAHWKSIFVSLVPSANGISNLISFLNSTAFGQCPQLTYIKIHFEEFPQESPADPPGRSRRQISCCQLLRELFLIGERRHRLNSYVNSHTKVNFISSHSSILTLHLSVDDCTNIPQVSAFLRLLLRKQRVPHLENLEVKFLDSKRSNQPGDNSKFPQTYKKTMETLEECDDVLRSLKVLKIHTNEPVSVSNFNCPVVNDFLLRKGVSDLPPADLCLGLSGKLKELQWGSGYVALKSDDENKLPLFFPGVLTPSVSSSLETLDLSGFYVCDRNPFLCPAVNYPYMPCLRKLWVEEATVKWMRNFSTIFEKAPAIREFRVKNSRTCYDANYFQGVSKVFNLNKWEKAWEPGAYPSLTRLELGGTIDVKDAATLQKINRIFPYIQVLQFTSDNNSRRISPISRRPSSKLKLMTLNEIIVEGLKEWKSLKHLTVTFWPLYSVTELLDHFSRVASELPSLRLYDFRRSDDANPNVRREDIGNELYFNQVREKFFRLKASSQLVFVLHNLHCPHQHHLEAKPNRLRTRWIMHKLFGYAEMYEIWNFRPATK